MDGALATYSNAGTFISVAAPGGDFRLDDNGGGGVVGPGWDFDTGKPKYLFGYGTSASAPFVSGIAALLLAQTPTLTAAQLRSRIEQFATRPAGATRSERIGWGIVERVQRAHAERPVRAQTIARLIDATTGAVARTTTVDCQRQLRVHEARRTAAYYVQAGDDEAGDGSDRRARAALRMGRRLRQRRRSSTSTATSSRRPSRSALPTRGRAERRRRTREHVERRQLRHRDRSRRPIRARRVSRDDSRRRARTRSRRRASWARAASASSSTRSCRCRRRAGAQRSDRTTTSTRYRADSARASRRTLTPGIYYITVDGRRRHRRWRHGRYRLRSSHRNLQANFASRDVARQRVVATGG